MAHCTVDIARPMVAWSIRWGKQRAIQNHSTKQNEHEKLKFKRKKLKFKNKSEHRARILDTIVCAESFRIRNKTKNHRVKFVWLKWLSFFDYFFFCRGPFMVSRLREFLMDHGHEDLIGRLQRGEISLPRAAELMNTSLTNLSGLLE